MRDNNGAVLYGIACVLSITTIDICTLAFCVDIYVHATHVRMTTIYSTSIHITTVLVRTCACMRANNVYDHTILLLIMPYTLILQQ